jgi:predicted ATPase
LLFALYGQWADHWARADLNRARQLADELGGLGEDTGDVPTRVMGCDANGWTSFHLGEFTAGRAHLERGLALYDPAHRAAYAELMSRDMLVHLLLHSAFPLACLGHLDQAWSRVDAALKEARGLSDPFTLAFALGIACLAGWFVRLEPKPLLPYADELLALTTEHGIGHFRLLAFILRGWCLAVSGHAEEGIPLLTTGLAGMEEDGFMAWRPSHLAHLGDACRIARRWPAALGHLAEAQRLAEETEERCFQAETLRLRGDVLLATGDAAAAEAGYHEAMTIAQQQSAKLWELRAATSLARLWRDQGRRSEARDLLAPVYGWFAEGFGTPVLQEARALLSDLG